MRQNLAELVRVLTERQQKTDRRLSELRAQINALEARIAEIGRASTLRDAAAAQAKMAQSKPIQTEVTPEILVVLAAAATAYLGKNVRVRSARTLQPPYGSVNLWAQQGRVSVQASHNWRWRR